MQQFSCHSYPASSTDETIVAVATPPGYGGIAIVRISGPKAIEVGDALFSGDVKSYPSHSVHYGTISDTHGRHIDQALLLLFRAPRSYTGADTVELHCHGGPLLARRLVELALEAGARPALPGEFSYLAFLHGKLDLAQAEAVQELISAQSDYALRAAQQQLEGALSARIRQFQQQLAHAAAIFEAWVDFPEEGLEFASEEQMIEELDGQLLAMEQLLATFAQGKLWREGVRIALVGLPNAGKSSLLNALLQRERAIVSAIPGTTRDLIHEQLLIDGMALELIDTAGLRDSQDLIEQEGVRRCRKAIDEADLLLVVLDASSSELEEEQRLLAQLPLEKALLVWNKVDLAPPPSSSRGRGRLEVAISAKEGWHLCELKEALREQITQGLVGSHQEVVITQLRHKEALERAIGYCRAARDGLLDGLSAELVAFEMRSSLTALGQIIGTDVTEDLLSAIFSTFCVGK